MAGVNCLGMDREEECMMGVCRPFVNGFGGSVEASPSSDWVSKRVGEGERTS
jgi:hypothetical protein